MSTCVRAISSGENGTAPGLPPPFRHVAKPVPGTSVPAISSERVGSEQHQHLNACTAVCQGYTF